MLQLAINPAGGTLGTVAATVVILASEGHFV
jgi:hypothetical protein